MTMTLDELKEAVADICAGCDSERSQFTNADLGDAIDAAIRERDRLRGDVDGLRDCVERAEAELAALKARIMEAPLHTVSFHIPTGITCIVCDVSMRGQRVRLVVEE